jgi:hypothetical protein
MFFFSGNTRYKLIFLEILIIYPQENSHIISLKQDVGAFYRIAYKETEKAEDFPRFGQFLIDR